MKYPILKIRAEAIEHNTRTVKRLLQDAGLSLTAVAKGAMCHGAVVRAMIKGGADSLGDSRIANLRAIRSLGFSGETVLLRSPSPSLCRDAVEVADVSLISSPRIAGHLGEAAQSAGKVHKVILMIDLGDLREGVLAKDAVETARLIQDVKGIELCGVGVNLACYGGVVPTREKMLELVAVKEAIEEELKKPLERVSGGNSANMMMVMKRETPAGITNLRIGESILLGTEAIERLPVDGCRQDTFTLMAEVIEVLRKPSKPFGKVGQNAFGVVPQFEDRGVRTRAICSVGRQDVDPDGLLPLTRGVSVIGASSDHLILDVEDAQDSVSVGTVISFRPNYSALLRASTSPFVEKVVE